MCIVSNVGDDWQRRRLPEIWPNTLPYPYERKDPVDISQYIRRPDLLKDVIELRKQIEEMRKELEAAREQDVAEGNADCEMEDKVAILKQIAKLFDIDLSKVFPND